MTSEKSVRQKMLSLSLSQKRALLAQLAHGKNDLEAEAVLAPDICPDQVSVSDVGEPSRVFLTGATGHLGAYLLRELIRETRAHVYCLVRSPDPEETKRKVQRRLADHGLWDEGLSTRMTLVTGDLAKPRFGLSEPQFRTLASSVDAIYHNGALVNWLHPYRTLKPPNVGGTQEVLRLATQVKLKPVHFVSTVAVFPPRAQATFREDDSLDPGREIVGGYRQTKWVAERIVAIARTRGVPVSIFRPGAITGQSRTGVSGADDLLLKVIKGCLHLGSAPETDTLVDIIPVDYASRAIVHLSRQPNSLGRVFHLTNPHPIRMSKMFDWLVAVGYRLRRVSYDAWKQELTALRDRWRENALSPFLPFLAESREPATPRFDCRNTLAALAGTDIVCPPVDAKLLEAYLSYYIRAGLLEKPEGWSA